MSASTLNRSSSPALPRSCQRLRLPSLTAALRSQSHKPDYGSQTRKEERRIVVMGSARVGKSSIISQFLYDKFLPRYRETVEELHRGEYELPDGASLTLDILDTSGAYQFPAMRALSISTGGAFILVYAVDDEETWNEVVRLREQVNLNFFFLHKTSILIFSFFLFSHVLLGNRLFRNVVFVYQSSSLATKWMYRTMSVKFNVKWPKKLQLMNGNVVILNVRPKRMWPSLRFSKNYLYKQIYDII